jgi:uncharacterized delta-60 repeat protein
MAGLRHSSGKTSVAEALERRTFLSGSVLHEEVNDFGAIDLADAVASDRNGRTYVLGHSLDDPAGNRLFIARYTEEGTLDSFFGENGRIFGTFSSFPRATSIAVDKSGRIVVAGVTNDAEPAIAAMRFTSSGFLDQSFGDFGLATIRAGTGNVVNDVATDASGRVVVAGQTVVTTGGTTVPEFLVARFDINGRADTSFGSFDTFALGDGVEAFPVGIGESGANSVVLDSNNRIVLGGFGTENQADAGPERRFAVARLDQFGAFDEGFGTGDDGIVTFDFGLPSTVQDLAFGKDGKLIATGNTLVTLDAPGEQVLVARLQRDGSLDDSFGGGDGFTISTFGNARSQTARQVRVDKKDRVLVAGSVNDTGEPTGDLEDDQFLLARYLSDGTPDTTFAPGGGLLREIKAGPGSLEQVAGLTIQQDGKNPVVIEAGNAGTSATDQDIAVLRIATDATDQTGSAQLNGSKLLVRGSNRDDVITISPDIASGTVVVNVNGSVQTFPGGAIQRVQVNGKDGDDNATCSVGGDVITTIDGGNGDDDLRLLGDAHGRLEGDDDDDLLVGGDRGDRIRGGDGDDLLFGGDGDDDITGDPGFDQLFGEGGDDDLKADDGFHDDVDGGGGDDEARIDFFDFVTRVDDVEVF